MMPLSATPPMHALSTRPPALPLSTQSPIAPLSPRAPRNSLRHGHGPDAAELDPGRIGVAGLEHARPPSLDAFERTLAEARRDGEIRDAARALTSQALVLPVLQQLRAGSLAWGPFRDNEAAKAFAPLLDQAISDRIAASPRLGVTERIEERLRARTQPSASTQGRALA
ncbi:MAG: hypothetical protein FJ253_10610 [Phycisphaerae bacterium]|nr:hypothetical protein [Phycisphaerae bacterium]